MNVIVKSNDDENIENGMVKRHERNIVVHIA